MKTPQERAARLLRWYPNAWRNRYGDEFAELLIADIEERPQSAERALDVVRAGLLARFAMAGLAEWHGAWQPDPARRVQVSLGTLCGALTACLALAAAMWSQLAIAWEWTLPATATQPTMRATLVMSGAVLAFLLLVVLAVAPVGYAIVRNRNSRMVAPLLVLAAAVSLLAFGGHHFLYQWPGSGGHGAGGTLFPVIPAGLQAFAWSLTYWFSVHWFWLATGLGGWEIAWIVASPLALAAAAAAAATLVRRAELSPGLLAYETRLAAAACAVMGVFLGGCGFWVYVGRPPGLAHAGQIDIVAAILLALALAAAYQAQRTALRGLQLVRG
ncbi:MAG TPA: hypothetical protein VN714_15445 [Trebonia sp.]|nr:hypothetical protein [Trebonia sp.]